MVQSSIWNFHTLGASKKPKGIADLEKADAVFGALAHPTRRQILLSVHYRGSCKAGELAQRFDCSWPTTSRHLATLVKAGLLRVDKSGRGRVYQLEADIMRGVLNKWLAYLD